MAKKDAPPNDPVDAIEHENNMPAHLRDPAVIAKARASHARSVEKSNAREGHLIKGSGAAILAGHPKRLNPHTTH